MLESLFVCHAADGRRGCHVKVGGPEPFRTHIAIREGTVSMTSGDIGEEVRVDGNGGLWSNNWGCDYTFHERREQSGVSAFASVHPSRNRALKVLVMMIALTEIPQVCLSKFLTCEAW